jgi:hypothetical protein
MLVMGMEAWSRLADLRKVAHVYALYATVAPLVHGAMGFAAGWALHLVTGFSAGGVVILAVMAASSSDISGPPTLRAAIPSANPGAYVGASTGIGTPVALLSIPPLALCAGAGHAAQVNEQEPPCPSATALPRCTPKSPNGAATCMRIPN